MRTWWVSFADEARFRGVVIVDAPAEEGAALARVKALGLDPGGESVAWEMPPDDEQVVALGRNRLIHEAELRATGSRKLAEAPPEAGAAIMALGHKVCDDCSGGGTP